MEFLRLLQSGAFTVVGGDKTGNGVGLERETNALQQAMGAGADHLVESKKKIEMPKVDMGPVDVESAIRGLMSEIMDEEPKPNKARKIFRDIVALVDEDNNDDGF
jgi:hypothetical protein